VTFQNIFVANSAAVQTLDAVSGVPVVGAARRALPVDLLMHA
jgi:hypothetical protein